MVKNISKRYSNHIKAQIIETWVNNPDISPKEMFEIFNISSQTYSGVVSKWFPYKGSNGVLLVLESNV